MAMIRVALLDGHPVVLRGMIRLLEPAADMEVLAAAADGAALARAARGRRADVLVMDYDPTRGDSLAACIRIKSRLSPPGVLLYTAYAGPALAIAARAAQADGLVSKLEPASEVLEAIRRVADGETVIPPVSRQDFEAAVSRLGEPDLPVFAMLVDGSGLPTIAEALRCDEREAAVRVAQVVRRLRPRLAAVTAKYP